MKFEKVRYNSFVIPVVILDGMQNTVPVRFLLIIYREDILKGNRNQEAPQHHQQKQWDIDPTDNAFYPL